MRTLFAFVNVAVVTAYASVTRVVARAGSRALRCRQPVNDLRVAGEIIDRLQAPFPFRTPGCLAKYVKATPIGEISAVFVTDFQSGRMIPAGDAWFVPAKLTAADGRTLEADYIAYKSRSDADSARSGQPLLRWAQVVAEATH